MKTYELHRKQKLAIDIDTCWEFFSAPQNLNEITPDQMDFKILSGADRKIFPGQIIKYKVKPFPFWQTDWVTEITHVKDGAYFVDEQRFGPYKFWHHKHFFTPCEGGVLIEDIIHYKLPLGFLGTIAHGLFVKKQLEGIFEYRNKKLKTLFATTP